MRAVVGVMVETPYGLHQVRVGGGGTPMMVIPGGPGWGADYMIESLVELLGERRRLFFVDQRGTGGSPVGSGPLTVEAYVEDMMAIADHLELDRFDILGHSFGGLQTLISAVEHQDRLDRIVIADGDPPTRTLWEAASASGSPFDQRTRQEDQAEIAELTADPLWMSNQTTLDRYLVLAYRPLYADPTAAEQINHGLNKSRFLQLQATTRSVRTALADWDITMNLKRVSNPTLLVYSRDSIFGEETPEALLDLLPNSKLEWVEGGHTPFIEDPEPFRTAVEDFLDP